MTHIKITSRAHYEQLKADETARHRIALVHLRESFRKYRLAANAPVPNPGRLAKLRADVQAAQSALSFSRARISQPGANPADADRHRALLPVRQSAVSEAEQRLADYLARFQAQAAEESEYAPCKLD